MYLIDFEKEKGVTFFISGGHKRYIYNYFKPCFANVLQTSFFFQILYYLISTYRIYHAIHRSFVRWNDLFHESESTEKNASASPLLYVRILESTVNLNFIFSMTYAQTLNGQHILNFLNSVLAYTKKFECQGELVGWRKIVSNCLRLSIKSFKSQS